MPLLTKYKYRTVYTVLIIILVLFILLSAATGAVTIPVNEILQLIFVKLGWSSGHVNSIHEGVFFQIRLPRTFLCIFVGASLSVSGALMQALFRNPIVEPGLIGTSSGSALGAALVLVLGKLPAFEHLALLGDLLLPFCAFTGGLLATLLVYFFSASLNRVNITVMILAGIAVNAIANGGTGFLAYMARDPQARSITFWSLGSLTGANWQMVLITCISTIVGFILALRFAHPLNVLQLGDAEAGYLGLNTPKVKIYVILINTLMVSVATSMVGVIAFIGLIIPHVLRLLKGSDNRYLIKGSFLLGAIGMLGADMICRKIIAPAEMPIGIVTAFTGAPVFLYLLAKMRSRNEKGGIHG